MDSRGNGSKSNNFKGNNARDHARQHNGNVFNNYENYYNLRQRRSDETLREDGRNQALLNAASEGQTPRVKHLLQLGAEIDYTDEYGLTALHHAALSGFRDTVSAVLEAGANVNAESIDCGTPLHLAALKGRSHIVRLLLVSRADVSRRSRMIGMALHCACYAGDLVVMDDLCNHGANGIALDVVQLPLLHSVHATGLFSSTDWQDLSAPDFRCETVQCQPWHLAFLGNNNSVLVFAPMRLSVIPATPWAWDVNLVQDRSSIEYSVHYIEPLNVLRVLVQNNNADILHTLLDDSSFIPKDYSRGGMMGYDALKEGLLLERIDCVKILLRFRAKLDIDQDELNKLVRLQLAKSNDMRSMLLDPSSTAPVCPKIRLEHMSVDVLQYNDIPWEFTNEKPQYILVRRELTESELNIRFEATAKLRSGKWKPKRPGDRFSGGR